MSDSATGPFEGTTVWFRLYYSLIVGVGLCLVVWKFPLVRVESWVPVLWWVAFGIAAELSPISVPRSGAYITVSSALDYAAIIIFGPTAAAIISTVVTVAATGARLPLHKLLFNASLFIIMIFAAGFVFDKAGGYLTSNVTQLILPLAACGATYFLVDTFGVSFIIALSQRTNPWRIWQRTYLWTIVTHLVGFVPLSAIMVVIYLHIGIPGVALFFVPLILARHSFKLYIDMREAHMNTVRALTSAIDASDPFTSGHSERVTEYSTSIARRMGLSERRVLMVEYASLLHDMGKIAIQHDVLLKPGKLSDDEWKEMRTHPETGARIVSDLHFLKGAREVVLYHHERYDGKGYPDGLEGSEIPLEARIVKVADAFDAMMSDRPYRRGLSMDAAIEELRLGKGTDFDAAVVDVFLKLISDGGVEVRTK